jgi:hypothetical protein
VPDAPGELLVVGHGDERTDRGPRRREISRRDPCRATRSGMCGVHGIYDFPSSACPGQLLFPPLLPLLPILLPMILPSVPAF